MFIYNVLLGLLFFFYILTFFKYWKQHPLSLLVFSCLFMLLIAAFKSISVGTDAENYYFYFQNVEVLKQNRIFKGIQRGWYYYNYFFHEYLSFRCFLFVNYAIIFIGFSYFLYKKSANCITSILLFFLLYFFCASLNVMRQYMAISIVLVGLTFFNKNKWKFCVCVLLASLFHYSALICYSFLLVHKKLSLNKTFYVMLFIIISFLLGFTFTDWLKGYIEQISIVDSLNEGASSYVEQWGGERNIVTNLLINVMFLISYFLAKNRSSFYLKLYFLYIIFNNLFGSAGQGNRLFLYFNMGILIALPEISSQLKNFYIRNIYNVIFIVYAYAIWYVSINANNGDVVPYLVSFD